MSLEPRPDQAAYTPDGHIVIRGGHDTPMEAPHDWSMAEEVEQILRALPTEMPVETPPPHIQEEVPVVVKAPKKKREGPTRSEQIRQRVAAMQADLQASTSEFVQQSLQDVTIVGGKLKQSAAVALDHGARQAVSVLQEGSRQFDASAADGQRLGAALYDESTTLFGHFWYFLKQPVWIPRKGKAPRKQSRGLLFIMDVARFGTTFALIFGTLFIGLNYQSFWQIASAELDPLANVADQQSQGQNLAAHLQGSDANTNQEDLSLVPTVGPPDNRLIVPKLNLNVPIVNPPLDSLLKEDWTGLEEDIQAGLQDGVVHYPGTARPGQAGNFFVTGHSSYYAWSPGKYKSVFARLSELGVGDEYWVYYGGDKHRYRITDSTEVVPSDVHVLDQPGDQRLSTLMTCTPVGTTLRRLIVSAIEIDPVTGESLAVGEHGTQEALPKVQVEVLPI